MCFSLFVIICGFLSLVILFSGTTVSFVEFALILCSSSLSLVAEFVVMAMVVTVIILAMGVAIVVTVMIVIAVLLVDW